MTKTGVHHWEQEYCWMLPVVCVLGQRQHDGWAGKMANSQWSTRVFLWKPYPPLMACMVQNNNLVTMLSSDLFLQPGRLVTGTQNCRRMLLLNSYWCRLLQMTINFPNLSDLGKVSKVIYFSVKCHRFCLLQHWIKIQMRVVQA